MAEKTVNVYYLGGLYVEGLPVQYVTAFDRAYVLPPVGEALNLIPAVANDLIRRYTIVGQNGSYISTFTLDAKIAKLVREGAYDPFAEQPTTQFAAQLSDDELIRELQRRGALPKAEVESPAENKELESDEVNESAVEENTEEAPARRGRKPKSEE